MSLNVQFTPACWEPCDPDYIPTGTYEMVQTENGKAIRRLTCETQGIIGLMMGIGMGKITDSTMDEFTQRAELWQDVVGPLGGGVVLGHPLLTAAKAMLNQMHAETNHLERNCLPDVHFSDRHAVMAPAAEAIKAEKATRIQYDRITAKDIQNHVGMSSNVSKITWAEFHKRCRRVVQDRLARNERATESTAA